MAFLGAHVRPGIDVVAQAPDLSARLANADLAITGEGRLDAQSLHGKVPAGVLRLARERSVPTVILCGDADRERPGLDVPVWSLVERFGRDVAMADARRCLEELAAETADRAERLAGGSR